jgi:hypothetical protein
MSRQNRVNPDRYKTGGRLSPDDLARERRAQQSPAPDERPRRGDDRPSWPDRESGAATAGEAATSEDGGEEAPNADRRSR